MHQAQLVHIANGLSKLLEYLLDSLLWQHVRPHLIIDEPCLFTNLFLIIQEIRTGTKLHDEVHVRRRVYHFE